MYKIVIFLVATAACLTRADEPISIGLGTLSPSYSQTVGKDGIDQKISFTQKENGFSYSVGDPKSGTNTYYHLGEGVNAGGPAVAKELQAEQFQAPKDNQFYGGPAAAAPAQGQILPAGFSYHSLDGQAFAAKSVNPDFSVSGGQAQYAAPPVGHAGFQAAPAHGAPYAGFQAAPVHTAPYAGYQPAPVHNAPYAGHQAAPVHSAPYAGFQAPPPHNAPYAGYQAVPAHGAPYAGHQAAPLHNSAGHHPGAAPYQQDGHHTRSFLSQASPAEASFAGNGAASGYAGYGSPAGIAQSNYAGGFPAGVAQYAAQTKDHGGHTR